jgi:hypothetical protein
LDDGSGIVRVYLDESVEPFPLTYKVGDVVGAIGSVSWGDHEMMMIVTNTRLLDKTKNPDSMTHWMLEVVSSKSVKENN